MFKKLLAVAIIIGCAFVWAQEVSRSIDVKNDEVNEVIEKSSIGVVKVEEIKTTEGDRDVPTKINFQGYLTDNDSQPINGNVSIEFSIHTSSSGGTQVWSSGAQTVNVSNGLFGKVLNVPYSVFEPSQTRWLQIKVGTQTLSPRIEITSSPWAYVATNADKIDGYHAGNSSGQIPISNGTVCTNLNSDKLDGYHYNNLPYGNGDITAVYADDGLTGGGTSNDVHLNVGAGTGISVSSNSVSFNTSWGDSRYYNDGETVDNSDKLDGYHYNNLPYLGSSGGTMTGVLNMQGVSVTFRTSGGTSRGYIKANNTYDQLDIVPVGAWVVVNGDFTVTGTKDFAQLHPNDPQKEIIYTCLEGGEAGTYCRGTAQLTNGVAIVNLPEHFGLVTSNDAITVQITALGDCKGLYVESKDTKKFIVKELSGGNSNVKFDYFAQGIRRGYENKQVIINKRFNQKNTEY